MSERNRYDELRNTQQKVDDDRARGVEPAPQKTDWSPDAVEARSAAKEQELDAKVRAGKINTTERVQEFNKWDNAEVVKMNMEDRKNKQTPQQEAAQQRAQELNEAVRKQKEQERGRENTREQDKER